VQCRERLHETFTHVGVYSGRSLAAADHFGNAKVHGNDFSVGAAEIYK